MQATTAKTLFDHIRERVAGKSWLAEIPLLILCNLVLVASAYISIPLPFSPVPITGQTFGLMLIAMALGQKRATGLAISYLVEGAMGLPVFAGGTGGLPILLGPTGGYLFGFVGAAFFTGWLADLGWDKSYVRSALAMLLGHVVVFAFGLMQLAFFVPAESLLVMGLTPFLIGTGIKIGLAAMILPLIWRLLRK